MSEPGGRSRGAARAPAHPRAVRGAKDAAERAAEELTQLVHHHLEGVSAVCRTQDDGWIVDVDVLELARIPDTTSLLATYQVELDADGELLQYRRTARYRRGAQDQ
ncbi:gas vesicle protein GvpO [Streptomyces sp. IBSBF 3136]|uniref:gas vesicle protein GvpO n=1 Tax=Streptomyces sp. IBSBF 3136 TaxID=2903524 RepID=UPI002FDBA832